MADETKPRKKPATKPRPARPRRQVGEETKAVASGPASRSLTRTELERLRARLHKKFH
jgi:hypothetical protein